MKTFEEFLEEATSIDTKEYSWGKLTVASHKNAYKAVMHPEHRKALYAMGHDETHHFKDEQGKRWNAHRDDDTIHLKSTTGEKLKFHRNHLSEQAIEEGQKEDQDKVFGKKFSELRKEKSTASEASYHLPGVGKFKDEAQARKAFPDHEQFKESEELDEAWKNTTTGQRGMKVYNTAVKKKTNTAVRKKPNKAAPKISAAERAARKAASGVRYQWDSAKTTAIKSRLNSLASIKALTKK